MGRFQVIEDLSHFVIRDNQTGQERPLGDGVDVLFDADGTAISPGTEGFCDRWAEALNSDEGETLEACFPEQAAMESGAAE